MDTHALHMQVGFVLNVTADNCQVQIEDEAGTHVLEDVGVVGTLVPQQQCLVFTADLRTWAVQGGNPGSGGVGTPGVQGPPGPKGDAGPQGAVGAPGPAGPPGPQGPMGTGVDIVGAVEDVTGLPTIDTTPGDAWLLTTTGGLAVYAGPGKGTTGPPGHDTEWLIVDAVQGPPGPQGPASTVPGPPGADGARVEEGFDPAEGDPGSWYFDKDAIADGFDSVPIGSVIAFGGSVAPVGWHLCDGSAHNSAALKAVIGSDTTPDLRGKFVLAASSSHPVKSTGGEETHTLTVAEMPAHGHGIDGVGDHAHHLDFRTQGADVVFGTNNLYQTLQGGGQRDVMGSNSPASNHSHQVVGDTQGAGGHNHGIHLAGGDGAHNNMPPFYALTYIIRKGVVV